MSFDLIGSKNCAGPISIFQPIHRTLPHALYPCPGVATNFTAAGSSGRFSCQGAYGKGPFNRLLFGALQAGRSVLLKSAVRELVGFDLLAEQSHAQRGLVQNNLLTVIGERHLVREIARLTLDGNRIEVRCPPMTPMRPDAAVIVSCSANTEANSSAGRGSRSPISTQPMPNSHARPSNGV
jgi:hypothetical protein